VVDEILDRWNWLFSSFQFSSSKPLDHFLSVNLASILSKLAFHWLEKALKLTSTVVGSFLKNTTNASQKPLENIDKI